MAKDNSTEEKKGGGLDEYLDLQSFINRYPQFKESQLRWLVVRKDNVGLSSAIKRVGRRLYFHVPTISEWVKSQNA